MNVREHFKRVSKLYALTIILLLSGVCSWAQVRVTGKVIDVNGQPMGFVTVIVKGTTSLATNSADNGTYKSFRRISYALIILIDVPFLFFL